MNRRGMLTPWIEIFFWVCLASPLFGQLTLDVVYPKEEQVVLASDSTFIFGAANRPDVRILVNDLPVRVYPNGAFLGHIPVMRGEFVFNCLAISGTDTLKVSRPVFIPPYLMSLPPDTVAIDTSYFFPNQDLELIAGDEIEVSFKGTPGLVGRFSIPGLVENVSMVEAPPNHEAYWGEAVFGAGRQFYPPVAPGIYRGRYRIPAGVTVDSARVHVTLGSANGVTAAALAPARITVRPEFAPRIAELTEPMTVARTGPSLGYQLFVPAGVKVEITGKKANHYRARLSRSEDVWLPAPNLNFLPEGSPVPHSKVAVLRSENLEDKVKLKIYLQERLPFKIQQSNEPSALKISVYGADANTDWIRYDFDQTHVREITWAQPENRVYEVTVLFNSGPQWGYNPYYDDRVLVLEIRKPPEKFSLKGKIICLDPGHGPQDGAIGPSRTTEKGACLQLAAVLKQALEKKGGVVFLTRQGSHGASLLARTKMAAYLEADLFLSLHYNALPDGVNPFQNRGTSTYYYHPQSLPLASAIQTRLLKKLKLPNYGLYYDNLAVCRITQMPSVLIEPAFMMHPDEEMLINSAEFRRKTAEAIVEGIEDYFKQAKKSQR